jgi:mycothiol synthase
VRDDAVSAPPGYTARPLTEDDAAAVAALVDEFDATYVEDPDRHSPSEVEGWWARLDLAGDSLAFFGASGVLAACGTAYERRADVLDLDAFVHPAYQGRGLGGALLAWLEDEGRRRGRSTLHTAALAADEAARTLVEARGFRPARHFYRMLIDLDAPPPDPVWPEGFEVSTFAPGDEQELHDVIEEAFADHWGHELHDLDHWQTTLFGQGWWDPSLVYIVRAGGEAVAAEINAVRFGMGWIGSLGTLEPWRGKGLGRALLLQAFGELYRRGERRIGLAVDADNETGATHLYESVGMRVAWQADVYEKRL